ncbi:DUF2842 domain-containing protein [Pontivivens ytuae]
MSYKARRRWSIILLLVWLPIYTIIAWVVLVSIPRQHIAIEFLMYAVAGILWALPFKNVFKGVGKPDPDG